MLLCIASVTGCQHDSGANLVTAPDDKSSVEGKKPQPPPPADPEISAETGDEILIMNADGSNVTTVVTGDLLFYPSWSPDGTQLVYMQHDTGLWVVNKDGTDNQLIVPHSACGIKANHPRWSPAGDEISCVGYDENPMITYTLWVFPTSGGPGESLYQTTESHINRPEWNHDGTKLLFDSNIYASDTSTLQVIDRATGVRTTVMSVPESEGRFVSGSWARQAVDTIAYHYWDHTTGDDPAIHTLDISTPGQSPQFVTYGTYPVFSPDNSRIAFEIADPRGGIFTYEFSGGDVERIARRMSLSDWRR
jgi:Tol biopolymer transport system component